MLQVLQHDNARLFITVLRGMMRFPSMTSMDKQEPIAMCQRCIDETYYFSSCIVLH